MPLKNIIFLRPLSKQYPELYLAIPILKGIILIILDHDLIYFSFYSLFYILKSLFWYLKLIRRYKKLFYITIKQIVKSIIFTNIIFFNNALFANQNNDIQYFNEIDKITIEKGDKENQKKNTFNNKTRPIDDPEINKDIEFLKATRSGNYNRDAESKKNSTSNQDKTASDIVSEQFLNQKNIENSNNKNPYVNELMMQQAQINSNLKKMNQVIVNKKSNNVIDDNVSASIKTKNKTTKTNNIKKDQKNSNNSNKKDKNNDVKVIAKITKSPLDIAKSEYYQKEVDFNNKYNNNIQPRFRNIKSFDSKDDLPILISSNQRSKENFHIPLILTKQDIVDTIFYAIKSGDINVFNESYKQINDPNFCNDYGDTLLTYATLYRQHIIINSLLNKGANPNITNQLGYMPIDIAIENKDEEAINIMIFYGANLKISDINGNSYLFDAVRSQYLPTVKALIEGGIDINQKNHQNLTVLDLAMTMNNNLIIDYLTANGAISGKEINKSNIR